MLVLIQFSCNVSSQQQEETEVYVSEKVPFELFTNEKLIKIPASLKLENFDDGTLVINYFLDSDGNTEGVNLKLLRMQDEKDRTILDYYNQSLKPVHLFHYPVAIQKYIEWVYSYAATRKIVRKEEVA